MTGTIISSMLFMVLVILFLVAILLFVKAKLTPKGETHREMAKLPVT